MRSAVSGLLVLLLVLGCDSDGDGGAADVPGGADVAGDVAAPPDGGGWGETPILERPARGTYACRVERARTDHADLLWRNTGQSLAAAADGTAWFARLESEGDPFSPAEAQFLVSPFAPDGTFGSAVEPSSGDPEQIDGPTLAPRGDGVAVVWIEAGRLRFAALDAAGAVVVAARDIAGAAADRLAQPRLAAGADGGFGLTWAPQDGEFGPRDVLFVALDPDGAPRGAPRTLAAGTEAYLQPAPVVVADAAGYALAWRERAGDVGQLRFAATDAAGAERIAPRTLVEGERLGESTGFDPVAVALLALGDGYLAAWGEARMGDYATNTGGGSTIRIARLDASGTVAGAVAPLRAPEDSIDEVEPALLPFGAGHVAVLWGRGTHIYICAGCVPDHRVDLVILDPADLVPLSAVATVANGAPARSGGLLRRADAALGGAILTAFQVTYHVHSEAGSAAFVCE